MKKRFLKYLSASLALLMLLAAFAACGKKDSGEIGDTGGNDAPDVSDFESETKPSSAIGATGLEIRDYGGRSMQIWYTKSGVWAPQPLFVGEDTLSTGDIVAKAGYTRNKLMEETYKVYMDYTVSDADHSGTGTNSAVTELRTMYKSGDTAKYDVIFASSRACGWLSQEGFFYDIAESDYINPDAYYYESQVNEQVKLFGKQYFASGYYSTQNTAAMSVMFVNLGIIESITQGSVTEDTLYQKALDHTWTMEYMLNLGKAYATPTQNTGDNLKDRYAFTLPASYDFPLFYDMGGSLLKYDENTGKYVCTVEDHQNLLTYLEDSLEKNPNVGLISGDAGTPEAFKASTSPFMYGSFYTLTRIMDSSIAWTTMPSPLYAEGDQYRSYSASYNLNFSGIPANCRDIDKATYLYEVFMAHSYDHVYPAYYEECFGTRYQPTSTSAQVFDMISASRVVCIADIYRLFEGTPISHMIGRTTSTGWPHDVGSGVKVLADTINASMAELGW